MENRLEQIEVQALQLSDGERAELASRLIASLSPPAEFDAAWAAELDRRVEEIEAGRATMLSVSDVVARARNLNR